MLRVVSEFMPEGKKTLLVLCDDGRCGQYATHEIDTRDEVKSVESIIKGMIAVYGWSIGVFGTICPAHTKMNTEAARKSKESESLIHIASPISLKKM